MTSIVMIDPEQGPCVKRTDPIAEATYTYWPYLLGPDTGCEPAIDFKYFFGSRTGSPIAEIPEADAYFLIGQPNNSSRIFAYLRGRFPGAKVCAFHGLHHYEAIERRGTFYPEEMAFYEKADAILCARRSDVSLWKTIFPTRKVLWLPVPYPVEAIAKRHPARFGGTLRVGFLVWTQCEASFLTAYAIHSRLGDKVEFLFLNVPKSYERGKEPNPKMMKDRLLPHSIDGSWSSRLKFRHTCVSTWLPYPLFLQHLVNCHLIVFAENKGHQGRLLMDCAALGIPCVCSDMTDMSDLLWPSLRCGPSKILEKAVEVAEGMMGTEDYAAGAVREARRELERNFGPKPSIRRMLNVLKEIGVL